MRPRTNNDLCTPDWILDLVRGLGTIELDPCSNPWSEVGARKTYSLDDGQDGLVEPWGKGLVFVNPPYGRGHMSKWSAKIAWEATWGVEIVALVKGDFSTRWWRVLREKAAAICYLHDRVSFAGGGFGSGNFPSSLFYYGPQQGLFGGIFWEHGDIRLL